jgi:hypothetical protein
MTGGEYGRHEMAHGLVITTPDDMSIRMNLYVPAYLGT